MMNALERQDIDIPVEDKKMMLVYDKECYEKALSLAREKRQEGIFVSLVAKAPEISADEYEKMAAKHHCDCSYVTAK